MPSVSWTHATGTEGGNAPGVAEAQVLLPASCIAYGAWAEPNREFGSRSSHWSCTPTTFAGHADGHTQMLGSFAEVDGSDVYVTFLFRCDPGQTVRIHMWTVA